MRVEILFRPHPQKSFRYNFVPNAFLWCYATALAEHLRDEAGQPLAFTAHTGQNGRWTFAGIANVVTCVPGLANTHWLMHEPERYRHFAMALWVLEHLFKDDIKVSPMLEKDRCTRWTGLGTPEAWRTLWFDTWRLVNAQLGTPLPESLAEFQMNAALGAA
jgi:hypothetical protein